MVRIHPSSEKKAVVNVNYPREAPGKKYIPLPEKGTPLERKKSFTKRPKLESYTDLSLCENTPIWDFVDWMHTPPCINSVLT